LVTDEELRHEEETHSNGRETKYSHVEKERGEKILISGPSCITTQVTQKVMSERVSELIGIMDVASRIKVHSDGHTKEKKKRHDTQNRHRPKISIIQL
tara:strand:- start:244 stop:537 length:294 start_codon:yes stop_codon:yes gene_type:complete